MNPDVQSEAVPPTPSTLQKLEEISAKAREKGLHVEPMQPAILWIERAARRRRNWCIQPVAQAGVVGASEGRQGRSGRFRIAVQRTCPSSTCGACRASRGARFEFSPQTKPSKGNVVACHTTRI
jgi:hypothetical protein